MEQDELRSALGPLRAKLEAEQKAILDKSAPLHAKREALLAKLQPLEAELREVNAQIKAIEYPALNEVGRQLAAVARASGAKSLKALEQG